MIGEEDDEEEPEESGFLSGVTEKVSEVTDSYSGRNSVADALGGSDEGTSDESETPVFEATGTNGRVELHERKIIIKRESFQAKLEHMGSGEKEIPLSRITSIQFNEPGRLTAGYILFGQTGYLDSGGPNEENSVRFQKGQKDDFETLREKIDDLRQDGETESSSEGEADTDDPALQALRKKYATGEISKEEYEERLKVLQGD